MERHHLYFKLSGGFDGKGNCVGDVVQFKVEKDICAGCPNGADDLRTFRGVKLQADFEKRDLVAQFLYEIERFFFCRDIQRDDEFVSGFCHSCGQSVLSSGVETSLNISDQRQEIPRLRSE